MAKLKYDITKRSLFQLYFDNNISIPKGYDIHSYIDEQIRIGDGIKNLKLADNNLLFYLYVYPKVLKEDEMLNYINYSISPYYILDIRSRMFDEKIKVLDIYSLDINEMIGSVNLAKKINFPVSIEYCKELIENAVKKIALFERSNKKWE